MNGAGGGFAMVVIDSQGRVTPWFTPADTESEARRIANENGYTVLECTDSSSTQVVRRGRLDAISFAADLSTLLAAGISVNQAVLTLGRRTKSLRERTVLAKVQEGIARGLRLSAAMEVTQSFPPLLIATIAASEQTGDVASGLARFSAHQLALRTFRDRLVGACVYPLLLLVVGSVVLMVLLGIVVPRFSQVLDVQSHDLPALSKLLMLWGGFAVAHPIAPLLLGGALLATAICILLASRNPARRRSMLEKLPFVRKAAIEFQHLQMYRTAAILTSRGVPIHRALESTLDYLGSQGQQRLRAGLDQIRAGMQVSAALSQCALVDDVAASMLAVAERSGDMPDMLDRIADFYERSLQRNVEIASRLIEPILMIVFGVLIGGIVLLMYLPIFDLASSIT